MTLPLPALKSQVKFPLKPNPRHSNFSPSRVEPATPTAGLPIITTKASVRIAATRRRRGPPVDDAAATHASATFPKPVEPIGLCIQGHRIMARNAVGIDSALPNRTFCGMLRLLAHACAESPRRYVLQARQAPVISEKLRCRIPRERTRR